MEPWPFPSMATLGHRKIMCEYTFLAWLILSRVVPFPRVLLLYHHLLMIQVRNINPRVVIRLLALPPPPAPHPEPASEVSYPTPPGSSSQPAVAALAAAGTDPAHIEMGPSFLPLTPAASSPVAFSHLSPAVQSPVSGHASPVPVVADVPMHTFDPAAVAPPPPAVVP